MYDSDPNEVELDKGLVAEVNKRTRTRKIKNNGWAPEWNTDNDVFVYKDVNPDTAFLVIKVKDQNIVDIDDDLGRRVVPLKSMKTGYRHVFLEDKTGHNIKMATVLVHAKLE